MRPGYIFALRPFSCATVKIKSIRVHKQLQRAGMYMDDPCVSDHGFQVITGYFLHYLISSIRVFVNVVNIPIASPLHDHGRTGALSSRVIHHLPP